MNPKLFIFGIISVVFLAGCIGSEKSASVGNNDVVFCTEDAKICPDGTAVSRTPPDCEFAACPQLNSAVMPEKSINLADLPVTDCEGDSQQTRCPAVGDTVAKIATNRGDVWLRLFNAETPKTVENFVGLSERGYYDDLIFHRVIPDFMIQGGDPTGTGTGGASIWGGKFIDEFGGGLSNLRGALSMANAGPNTNGSQFFIVQAPDGTPFLDGRHTVFGQVFAGMKIVDEIAGVDRDAEDKPKEDVTMNVEVFQVGE